MDLDYPKVDDNQKIIENIVSFFSESNAETDTVELLKEIMTVAYKTSKYLYEKKGKEMNQSKFFELICARLRSGYKEYKQGLKINEDTRKHGTKFNDWTEMGLEELLDCVVYFSAAQLSSSGTEC